MCAVTEWYRYCRSEEDQEEVVSTKILVFSSISYCKNVSHKPESVAGFGTCCWTKANHLKSAIPLLKLLKRNMKKTQPRTFWAL